MDKDRQFRMLIPPFFLFASVLWEAYLSGDLSRYLATSTAADATSALKPLLSIIAVGGIATLPIGYAIGILTIRILKLPARFFPNHAYDIPMSKEAMHKIWGKLGVHGETKKHPLCAASLFEFVLLRPQVHSWLFRRWTMFNIGAQCTTALLSSYFVGRAMHIRSTCKWWLTILFFCCLFVAHAVDSWREVYRMMNLVVDLELTMHNTRAHDAD
jgi:hypothetical protein